MGVADNRLCAASLQYIQLVYAGWLKSDEYISGEQWRCNPSHAVVPFMNFIRSRVEHFEPEILEICGGTRFKIGASPDCGPTRHDIRVFTAELLQNFALSLLC